MHPYKSSATLAQQNEQSPLGKSTRRTPIEAAGVAAVSPKHYRLKSRAAAVRQVIHLAAETIARPVRRAAEATPL